SHPTAITAMHLASGDRWAGAEVQLFTLLTQLRCRDDVVPRAILLNDGELALRLRQHDIDVDILDESRLSSTAIFAGLRELLRKHSPQILHTHRLKENILGTLANTFANTPTARARSVRTVHGAPEHAPRRLPQKAIRALDIWTGNHLQQRVIAVSQDLAGKLRNDFRHVDVIENGVDIGAVRATVKPVDFRLAAPDTTHIGIVGRLDPVKRIDIFLTMAAQLLREQPQKAWHFHVFGEGALETALKAQAAALQIDHAVTFHGHRRDIAACIAGLDAIVMCSDHEGLPMTVLEALAVGTPMLAHATGGLNAVLAGGAGGLLVANHSTAGYVQGLLALLDSDRTALKANGLSRLQAQYSAGANAQRVAELYRSLLPKT